MSKNAIELLKEDHKKVKGLLAELAETTTRAEKKRLQLLEKIEMEILIHARIEEEIFYPAFKEAGNSEHSKIYFEALEEHRTVEKMVLPDLRKTPPTSEQFSGRAKVLKELIEHHAEEEESDMFKKATKALSKEELLELGEQMSERKLALQRELSATKAA